MIKYSFIVPTLKKDVPILNVIKKLDKTTYAGEYECILATAIGKAKCRNLAASQAKGRYLVFVDSDCWCYPEILIWMLFWITEHPNEILSYYARAYCTTRALAISKEQFYKLKGFNEAFHEPMDQEFGIRAIRSGVKIHYIPREWIIHIEHPGNRYIEIVRRPFERMKMLVCYPSEMWNTYAEGEKALLKFVWRGFMHTSVSHGIIGHFIESARSLIMFYIAHLWSKTQPNFKSSLKRCARHLNKENALLLC